MKSILVVITALVGSLLVVYLACLAGSKLADHDMELEDARAQLSGCRPSLSHSQEMYSEVTDGFKELALHTLKLTTENLRLMEQVDNQGKALREQLSLIEEQQKVIERISSALGGGVTIEGEELH